MPAEELEEFNRYIAGPIEVVAQYQLSPRSAGGRAPHPWWRGGRRRLTSGDADGEREARRVASRVRRPEDDLQALASADRAQPALGCLERQRPRSGLRQRPALRRRGLRSRDEPTADLARLAAAEAHAQAACAQARAADLGRGPEHDGLRRVLQDDDLGDVAGRADAVLVGIGLVGVRDVRTVVGRVRHAVAVAIGRRGVVVDDGDRGARGGERRGRPEFGDGRRERDGEGLRRLDGRVVEERDGDRLRRLAGCEHQGAGLGREVTAGRGGPVDRRVVDARAEVRAHALDGDCCRAVALPALHDRRGDAHDVADDREAADLRRDVADGAHERHAARAEVDGVEAGRAGGGDACREIAGVARGRDVEAQVLRVRRRDPERPDRDERAVVRRRLDRKAVRCVIDGVQRRRGRTREAVRVARADPQRRSGIQRPVGGHEAVGRVDPVVLARGRHDAHPIGDRVEVDSHAAADVDAGVGRGGVDGIGHERDGRSDLAGAGVERADARRAGHSRRQQREGSRRRSQIRTMDGLAGIEPGDPRRGQDRARSRRIERHEPRLGGRGDAEHESRGRRGEGQAGQHEHAGQPQGELHDVLAAACIRRNPLSRAPPRQGRWTSIGVLDARDLVERPLERRRPAARRAGRRPASRGRRTCGSQRHRVVQARSAGVWFKACRMFTFWTRPPRDRRPRQPPHRARSTIQALFAIRAPGHAPWAGCSRRERCGCGTRRSRPARWRPCSAIRSSFAKRSPSWRIVRGCGQRHKTVPRARSCRRARSSTALRGLCRGSAEGASRCRAEARVAHEIESPACPCS